MIENGHNTFKLLSPPRNLTPLIYKAAATAVDIHNTETDACF